MGVNLQKRVPVRKIVLLILAGLGVVIIAVAASTIMAYLHEDRVNAQRLKVLQADAILRCRVRRIAPWHEKQEMNADRAGSTHGIGFGGLSLTSVTRMFTLNGADPPTVIDTFRACAQSSGWALARHPYAALSGTKTFPGGWKARLNIYIMRHAPFAGEPLVQVLAPALGEPVMFQVAEALEAAAPLGTGDPHGEEAK